MLSSSPSLPSSSSPTATNTQTTLRRLLDETADLIDSPTFTHVLTQLLDAGFSLLVETKIAEQAFQQQPRSNLNTTPQLPSRQRDSAPPGDTQNIEREGQRKVKLANILAVITRQAHNISNTNSSNVTPSMINDTSGALNPDNTNTNGNGNGNGSNGGMLSNEYLSAMEAGCKDLEAFAAVIYSSNFEVEDPDLNLTGNSRRDIAGVCVADVVSLPSYHS